jgi:hypothetical protein
VAIKTLRPNDPEDPGDDDDYDDSSSSDQEASSSEGDDDEGDDDDNDDDQEDTPPNDNGPDDNDLEDPNALEEPTPSNDVDMYEALAAHQEREESEALANEAELREPDSDDGPLSEGDITPEANKGVTEPTPGVPEAAAIPKDPANFVWPKHRAHSGGKRQFWSLPLQRDRPPARDDDPDFTALLSTKARVTRICHKAFLAGETSYGYVPPKVKIRSVLSSQQDIVTLFNNLDRQEEEKKVRTVDYWGHVLDTIGSDYFKYN